MLHISLDESGQFTKAFEENSPVFIGGVIYDDQDKPGDYENEQKRIDLYLRSVCENEEARYPNTLHCDRDGNDSKLNTIKRDIRHTLEHFLRDGISEYGDTGSGRELDSFSRTRPREGKYYIYAYVKYGTVMGGTITEEISRLVKDDNMDNLYLHMAADITARIIFHNPVISQITKVHVDFASRSVNVSDLSPEENAQFQEGGYKPNTNCSTHLYKTSNADVFRTALAREMLYTNQKNIQIEDFSVRSINYYENSNFKMSFLYMADIVCSVLCYKAPQDIGELITKFNNRANNYTGHQGNLIFAYDDEDQIFSKAWEQYEEGDYYEALRLMYDGEHNESPYESFYEDVWFKCLKEHLYEMQDTRNYSLALRKFYLSTQKNNLNREELLFIFSELDNMKNVTKKEKNEKDEKDDKDEKPLLKDLFKTEQGKVMLYELYDAGVSAFCHIGDSEGARECYMECQKYAQNIDMERYLETRNKMVVFLTDEFSSKEAIETAKEDVEYQKKIMNIRELIFGKSKPYKNYGKALSQLGQTYAFLQKKEAEGAFKEALGNFGPNTSDWYKTMSYLLHYYLEMGQQQEYDDQTVKYFNGKETLDDQFNYILQEDKWSRESDFDPSFALYFFVKGVYLFHMEDLSDELLISFCDIETKIRRLGGEEAYKRIQGHPWEIIYKYLALIVKTKGKDKLAETYIGETESDEILPREGFTLKAIVLFGRFEYEREIQNLSGEQQALETLQQYLIDKGRDDLCGLIDDSDIETSYKALKEDVFSYMYS